MPTEWQPNDAHRAKAAQRNVDLSQEVEKFRLWEFSTPKTNFDLAFHRWLTNATPRRRYEQAYDDSPRRGETYKVHA